MGMDSKKFAFKCHRRAHTDHPDVPRNESHLFPVNMIAFNVHGTFATGGGDGSINFWCKQSRTRLKSMCANPLSLCFSRLT